LCSSLNGVSSKFNQIVTAIDSFSKTNLTNSEPNTKKRIIELLLETLGWDTRTNEVQLEYPIVMASGTSEVDYALMLENKPVVFVEAKAFDNSLIPKHAQQAISYGKVRDVQWVVLTNGRTLKIFDTKQGITEKDCLVIEIDLTKLPTQVEDLNIISRDSILSGGIEDAVRRLAATKKAIWNLRQKQGQIAEGFKRILLEIAGKAVETRIESLSDQLARQATQLFEEQSVTVVKERFEKDVQLVSRKQLATKPPGRVVICPSKIAGVEFLKKYNAWGFVNMREQNIPYFALYVGKPESSISYFGDIESITKPLRSKEDLSEIRETDIEAFEPGKRAIFLKPGTLVKLADPIPLKDNRFAPRSRLYTTLEKLTGANRIQDLWEEVTLKKHLEKIKSGKMRDMLVELRTVILKMSDDIKERIAKNNIIFLTSVNFARIYTQPRGFWLSVKVPKAELAIPGLDARPSNPRWTDIRVDESTDPDLLVRAVKLAHRRIS